jgi:hypothetical protein
MQDSWQAALLSVKSFATRPLSTHFTISFLFANKFFYAFNMPRARMSRFRAVLGLYRKQGRPLCEGFCPHYCRQKPTESPSFLHCSQRTAIAGSAPSMVQPASRTSSHLVHIGCLVRAPIFDDPRTGLLGLKMKKFVILITNFVTSLLFQYTKLLSLRPCLRQ